MKGTNGFAERLAELRALNGIYQKELADYLNVTIGTVSNYENGIHQPDLETLCRLADYYGVSTDYLLGRTHSHPGGSSCPQDKNVSAGRLKKIFAGIPKMPPNELNALELLLKIQKRYTITATPKKRQPDTLQQ